MSNKSFKKLLNSIKKGINSAKSSDDIVNTVFLVKNYDGPLKFKNTIPYGLSFFSFVLGFVYFMGTGADFISFKSLITWVVSISISLIFFFYGYKRNDRLSSLSKKAYLKDAEFDNELQDGSKDIEELKKDFLVFNSGNNSQKIQEYKTYNNGDSSFEYFNHHYVEQRTETYSSTDGKGNSTMKTRVVYDHYDRYGIILPFEGYDGVIVKENVPCLPSFSSFSYKPAFNEFNKLLSAYGKDELTIAKFLKPIVVEKMVEYSGTFNNFLIEINNGKICISTSTPLLDTSHREYGYDKPDEFITELSGHTQFTKLEEVKEIVEFLNKYL